MTRKIKGFWEISLFKKCWLCGKRKITLHECCGRRYCTSCFAEHHEKFHINRDVNKRTTNLNEGKYLNNPGSYAGSDLAKKGVIRYQARKQPIVQEDRHQKELEDSHRK
jgi:hypothetical protein